MGNIFTSRPYINPEIREFIEDHIDLIENEEWEEFCQYALTRIDPSGEEYDYDGFGKISELLLYSGIDILKDLKHIMPGYLYNANNLIQIEFPDNIIIEEPYILEKCTNLTTIIFPKNFIVSSYYNSIADNCLKLNKVIYKGSVEEYEHIVQDKKLFSTIFCPNVHKIICSDGSVIIR